MRHDATVRHTQLNTPALSPLPFVGIAKPAADALEPDENRAEASPSARRCHFNRLLKA
jgi:hypothetical protein